MTESQTTALGTPTTGNPLRVALILLLTAGLAVLIPFTQNAAVYAIASLMAFLAVAPAWYSWQKGRFDAFEPINIIGMLYFVYFGLGTIWAVRDPVRVAYDIYLVPFLPRAALYCALGYLALLAGYLGLPMRSRSARQFEEFPRGLLFLLVPAALGFAGSLAAASLFQVRWFGGGVLTMISALAQFAPLFIYAWALSWMLLLSRTMTTRQKWFILGVVIPAAVMIAVQSLTDKSLLMTLIGVPIVALWYTRGKIPWVTLTAMLLVLIFVVFPLFNTYRIMDERLDQTTRLSLTYNMLRGWSTEKYLKESLGTFKLRLALINSVAVVVRDVGRWVPYAKGETLFFPAFALFVPRIIWPDKIVVTMGRDFGETFRVVHILDQETNVGATVPGELFWNFDLPGILIGMAIWGLAMRLLYRRFGQTPGLDPVNRAIHIMLLVSFVHFGGGLAAEFVGVLRTMIMILAYLWVSRSMGLIERRSVAAKTPAAAAG